MTMAHDLLEEPLLSWRDREHGKATTTLPGILARLGSGDLVDFTRVRAHQFHPWSMFLTQLAAIALHRAGRADPGLSEQDWRSLLLDLTDGAHEPWCLVVEDLGRPAFFQPPVPEGSIERWSAVHHPDSLDVLVTAKAHDVKTELIAPDDFEAWIYALTTLQTMQGYPGRGYNRIARMKGGYGSRPRVGLAAASLPAARFVRDVAVLLDGWPGQLARGYSQAGIALTWMSDWDGTQSLGMADLAPHFVEICWRVRLRRSAAGLRSSYATTKVRRCLPQIDDGDVGDPWIPVERDGGALTISSRGFTYQVLARLLFSGDFEPAAAQVIRQSDGDPVLLLTSAMARGQGKTEGLHERTLVISGIVRRRLGYPDGRAEVGKRAELRVAQAEKMRSKVLFPALRLLALGETVVSDAFHDRVDAVFFDRLFSDLDQADDEARLAWDFALKDFAWSELQGAIARCCMPDARRFRAISAAEGIFNGCLNKQFPDLVAAARGSREAKDA
jgi:CRISPR system Cascade subunit CasA